MDGTKDISCVMSHEHRSELQFNQAACPGSRRQHVPGVIGHSRELQAIPGSYRLTYPKQNPKQIQGSCFFRTKSVRTRFPGVTGHFRELQAIFGSYSPFSGVTDPGFGSDTIFAIWFGLLRIASGFASDGFVHFSRHGGFASDDLQGISQFRSDIWFAEKGLSNM